MVPALGSEAAASVVAPCFDAVRDVFSSYEPEPGHPLILLAKTRLLIDAEAGDDERHFARCRTDGRQIELAPQAADLPIETLTAILSHEFGHAADFTYPAHFRLVGRYQPAQWKPPNGRRSVRKVRDWEGRTDDQIEWAADAIAYLVTGRKIGYCGPCMVQCFSGRSRPAGLR